MKHAKRIVGLVLCLALCLGLLAALGGARVRAAESGASGSLLRQFYTLFGRFSRYQSSTSLTGDQPKVVLTLGELEFEGLLIAPRIATLTDEEIDGVLHQTMAELGVNVEELNRAYERAIHLETRFNIEGIKKLRDYFAQYVPFGGVGVTVVRSIENGKLEGGAAGAVESASTDLLGTSLSLVSDGALGLAKNPSALVSIGGSAGSAALGAIGGYKEAKDNTRYEKFIKESDQMLALVARFYSLAFQRLTNLLEAKNKDNELRWNILFAGSPAKKQIGDKSLWGVGGQTVQYELYGSLYRTREGGAGGDEFRIEDRSGTYEGELYLTVTGMNMAENFDARFRDACTLNETDDGHLASWDVILQKYGNTPFYLDDVTEAHADVAEVPTAVTRRLAGNFTATLGATGTGPVAFSGSFNNLRDDLEVQFQHRLYYRFYMHYYEEADPYPIDHGQVEETVTITAVPGTIAQLHVVDQGNEAAVLMETSLWWQFQAPGRTLPITKAGQGTFFDQLEAAPTLELRSQ